MGSSAYYSQLLRLWGVSQHQKGAGRNNGAAALTRFSRTPLIALLVAIGYYAGSRIGFILTPAQTPTASFWPPNAILLAAFLLTPVRMWWALLLAVLPAHLLVQLHTGIPVSTVLGWFVGNTGEALLGAACVRYFERDKRSLFKSAHGVTIYLLLGVFAAPLLTSFLDAAVVVHTGLGRDYWMVWAARLFSNMLANLTVTPTIVLCGLNAASWIREARLARYIEAGLLGVGIMLGGIFIFGAGEGWRGNTPALLYGALPFLLWASVRFGPGGLSVSLLAITVTAMWNVMHGRDPFISGPMEQNVLTLKTYLVTIGVPLMYLSAVIPETRWTSRKLIDAQEQERQRIGRELHDDIGQQLVLIGLEVERLQSDSLLKQRLDTLYEQISRISKATQDLSHELHPAALMYVGLAKALRTLCRNTAEAASITINFSEGNVTPLAADISLCLYRVAQEALQNIAKHSHAHTATVELRIQSEQALLRIVDDGIGMDPEQQSIRGMGLTGMRERLLAVHGKLKVTSAPMSGTTIEGSVPLTNGDGG